MTVWVFVISCLLLFWAGFCRLTRTDKRTVLAVRLAFYALTVVAAVCVAAVLVWGYMPGWPSALLASAMAAVLMATSRIWREGVPRHYLTEPGDL
jgi:glucose-6-phosphate-specific signal transduction histidine kinase